MSLHILPAHKEPSVRSALRILLVDDHADTVCTTAVLLVGEGHDVETAKDGASALLMWKSFRPHVILLDIGLPDMDGWDVAGQIRKTSDDRRPVLIALSGYGTAADHQRSREAGIDLHLVKPIDPQELFEILAKIRVEFDSWGASPRVDKRKSCAGAQSTALVPYSARVG